MSSSSRNPDLRRYGLEFIQDLAKDREYGMQEIRVSISSFKSNLVNRRENRQFIEKLAKSFDKDVKRTLAR